MTTIDRIMARLVITSGCWLWTGACTPRGYGQLWANGGLKYTHRLVLAHKLGKPLRANALHTCDTPACCNPDHLYEGDQAANAADRERRGRGNHPAGAANGQAKLTAAMVRQIRSTPHTVSAPALARIMGVPSRTINNVRSGHTWKVA
jgi:hypothetical protein